jgi:hypothetical protein
MWWFGCVIAFAYSLLVLPARAGTAPKVAPTLWPILWKGMIFVPFRQKAVHVHHWLIYGTLFLLVPLPSIVEGFVVTMAIQGLRYPDRFQMLVENPFCTPTVCEDLG